MEPSLPNDGLPAPDRFGDISRIYARIYRYRVVVAKHWWILVFSVALVLAPVGYLVAHAPSAFESKAKMWLTGKLNLLEGRVYSEEVTGFLSTQAEILRSATIREKATLTIQKKHPSWTNDFEDVKLSVRESPKTTVLELSASGPDPEQLRVFLDAIMEEYLGFRKDSRTLTSSAALSSVVEQLNQLEQDIRKQQERMRDFQVNNNLLFLKEQGNSAANYLAQIDRSLASLRTEFKLLQIIQPDQVKDLANRMSSPGILHSPLPGEGIARQIVMDLAGPQAEFFKATQQITMYRAKLEELSKYLRPLHPKILKLNNEILALEKLRDNYNELSVSQLDSKRQSLALQIQNLESAYKEWDTKATDASRKTAEYERMDLELKRSQSLYERLLGVMQTVDLSKNLSQETVSVLEHASEPKIVEKGLKRLALSLVGGLFLGLGILYLIEMFDDRFTTLAELRTQLTEMVIGQIPNIKKKKEQRLLEMMQPESEHHVFVESFRNLRSSLLFMFETSQRPKTILVTSSAPAEGKSTIAANLAITLAQAGAKVLLIDADLRCGCLHHFFQIPLKPGFAEVLNQEVPYTSVIQVSNVKNLSVIAAGETLISPSELFLGPSTQVFLRQVCQEYDYILIDSVPVLAADDTTSLAPSIDGVVFVVRASFTSARSARDSLEALHQRNVRILGLVFNRATPASGDQYYYYYYKYYSYATKARKDRDKKSGSDKGNDKGANVGNGRTSGQKTLETKPQPDGIAARTSVDLPGSSVSGRPEAS
jgi:polysaccharide biosynthesis transport protein